MKEVLVSVIIPAYNVGNYLEECVRSLLCQTYRKYEIIIIDDGSTDSTYIVGKKLALENNKIKIFHQENQGVSVARNVGMQKARGEYYIFVDADDTVAPQYIDTLVTCVEKADMGMIGFTSEKDKLTILVKREIVYDSASNIIQNILCETNYDGYLWDKIFQRRIIEKNHMKFKKNIVVWEDLLFVLEYLENCKQAAILDDNLYYYRYREGSAVNSVSIDKYRSKYEVMEEIKRRNYDRKSQSKKKISFLYLETMFSYLNQVLIYKKDLDKIDTILSKVSIIELLEQKNTKLLLKFLYLKIMAKIK